MAATAAPPEAEAGTRVLTYAEALNEALRLMHIADLDRHMPGANGIVGGGMGLATGAALTARLQQTGAVAICFFGDGALEQGILHETTNLAAIWKLPVVFVCENNQYAMSARSDWSVAGGEPAMAAQSGFPRSSLQTPDVACS